MSESREQRVSRRDFMKGAGVLAAGAAVVTSGVALTACSSPSSSSSGGAAGVTPGTYIGVGDGRGGPIVAQVEMSADGISSVEIIANYETQNVGSVPVETYPQIIVDNQSTAIDSITGATISSMAVLQAVNDAITKSGDDPKNYSTSVATDAPSSDTSADIVVMGSGGAGLAAAVRAAEAGKKVVLLEKMGIFGGTSNFSIESYGAYNDKTHKALGSPATFDSLLDTYLQQNPNGTAEAFTTYLNNCGPQADWLRSIGCEFTIAGAQNSVSGSREIGPFGLTITGTLHAEAVKQGVDIRYNSAATEIVMENGAVSGVKVTTGDGEYTLATKALIIASGGFAANSDMVKEYNPTYGDLNYSCGKGSTGDGHNMAEAVGAQLVNMDYIRVNFTYTTADNGYFYYMGCIFNTGGIFVNDKGQRYVNDQGGYGVGPKIVAEGGGTGWGIFDNSIMVGSIDVRDYEKLGLYESADTIDDLADKIGVDKAGLNATIETYRGYVAAGKDEAFNRPMVNMTFDEPPFYACKMTCRNQGTFGGIKSSVNAEVLDSTGTPIPGLYAAGECAAVGTWGAHPASVNVVFGSIAGTNAAAYVG